jgi:hypothetical protein
LGTRPLSVYWGKSIGIILSFAIGLQIVGPTLFANDWVNSND